MSCRPSSLLNLEADWDAYCLDSAVVTFGRALENAMEAVSSKSKNPRFAEMRKQLILGRWLDLPDEGRFKSPKAGTAKAD